MLSLGILVLYIFQLKRRKGIISIISCICRCLPKYIFCVHIFCCADIWLCIYFIVDKYHSEYILWWVCIIVAVSHRKLTLQVHPVIQNIDRQFCAARQMSCFHGALNWMNRLCYQRFAWGTAVDFLPLIKMHELQGVAKLHKVCCCFFCAPRLIAFADLFTSVFLLGFIIRWKRSPTCVLCHACYFDSTAWFQPGLASSLH